MKNILSIDLECFISVYEQFNSAERTLTSEERKKADNGYIVRATEWILKELKKANVKITFFVVAELYDWYPELIEFIRKEGHEIGYHTHEHVIIQNKQMLQQELVKSKQFLKEFKPKGFRAPRVHLPESCFKLLKEKGFVYDSSSYEDIGKQEKIQGILEVPISVNSYRKEREKPQFPKHLTFGLLKYKFPIGSGYAVGILGRHVSKYVKKHNREGKAFNMFMHAWQIVPFKVPTSTYIKGFLSNPLMLPYFVPRQDAFKQLLRQHEWVSFREYIKAQAL